MLIKNIHTPEELIAKLNEVQEESGYFEVLHSMDINIREWDNYITWSEEKYARNCIAKTEDYELLILCWEKKQSTPIQDYNHASTWVHPISGCIREERYMLSNKSGLLKISSVSLDPDSFSFMKHTGIHKFTNTHESRSMALVLYTKPITERKIYECTDGMCKTWTEKLEYDNVCIIEPKS
jgi:cysteine dioxygenase